MRRIMYIDSFQGVSLTDLKVLNTQQDIYDLIQSKSFDVIPEELTLDVRGLSLKALTSMLKFIEEYKGTITLIINDPVPLPILSRFIEIHKNTKLKAFNLKTKIYNNLSRSLKTKIYSLYDIDLDKLT